jgi:hypothetical protein
MANQERSSPLDVGSMMQTGLALQKKAIEVAQGNMKMTFDFVAALMACRSPSDITSVTREFTKKQLDAFQEQAKELIEIASSKKK